MMKVFRIIILLLILLFSAFYSKLQRLQSTAWVEPLSVAIYPINVDGHAQTGRYIDELKGQAFQPIEQFFKTQWVGYGEFDFDPVVIQLMQPLSVKPPAPPQHGNVLKTIFWSLRLRFWAYQHSIDADKTTVNIFIQYQQFDSKKNLAHSLGLQKGLIGVVNAYAGQAYQETNNVVVAHELLHTVGASDKYDLKTGQPIFPDGFAAPLNQYKQRKAELMAGKIPVSDVASYMPRSLRYCMIGNKTATEIGWIEVSD